MADFKYDSTHNADSGKQPGDPVGFNSKMGWGNVFERSFATPLDRTELFMTYADALAYATGGSDLRGLSGTSYPGQIITVLENNTPGVYVIAPGTVTNGVEDPSTRTLVMLAQGGQLKIATTIRDASTASNDWVGGELAIRQAIDSKGLNWLNADGTDITG